MKISPRWNTIILENKATYKRRVTISHLYLCIDSDDKIKLIMDVQIKDKDYLGVESLKKEYIDGQQEVSFISCCFLYSFVVEKNNNKIFADSKVQNTFLCLYRNEKANTIQAPSSASKPLFNHWRI